MPKLIRFFGSKSLSLELMQNHLPGVTTPSGLIDKSQLILAEQKHSDIIVEVTPKQGGAGYIYQPIPNADALITCEKNILLTLKTADCIPILIYEKRGKAVAAVHVGRLGVQLNIIGKTIKMLCQNYGCLPENLKAEMGPAICDQHYQVDEFTFREFVIATGSQQTFPYLNLKQVALQQLQDSQLSLKNISNLDICTFEDEKYFSYRENKTDQRQISGIGMMDV